jgi:hypothetical protein
VRFGCFSVATHLRYRLRMLAILVTVDSKTPTRWTAECACGLLLLAAASGCSGERGQVAVMAYTRGETSSIPASGSFVSFQDKNGASRTVIVDETGRAEGEIETGGTVWWTQLDQHSTNDHLLTAYTDVQAGSTLVFGPEPKLHAPVGSMLFIGDPPNPVPGETVTAFAVCGRRRYDLGPRTLLLDDRCGSTVDVLLVAEIPLPKSGTRPVAYAYLAAQTIVGGSTVTAPPEAWKDLDTFSLLVTSAEPFPQVQISASVENDFGFIALPGEGDPTLPNQRTVRLPLVGANLHVTLGASRQRSKQQVVATVPLGPAVTIDLESVGVPWVSQPTSSTQPWTWTQDDRGGTLRADITVTKYYWTEPIANYEQRIFLRVISPLRPPSDFSIPRLPSIPGAPNIHQPGEDFRAGAEVQLVRFPPYALNDLQHRAEELEWQLLQTSVDPAFPSYAATVL